MIIMKTKKLSLKKKLAIATIVLGFAIPLLTTYHLNDKLPRFAGIESNSGNIPITMSGEITEGPYQYLRK